MSETPNIFYICEKHAKLQVRVGNTRLKFEAGRLDVTDPEIIAGLDKVIATVPFFMRSVKKVDKAAAEKMVLEMQKKAQFKSGAVKGGLDSQNILNSQTVKPLEERDAALANITEGQKDVLTEELARDSDLVMTEKVSTPIVSTVDKPTAKLSELSALTEKKV